MKLGEPVKVRFSLEQQFIMESEAARAGKPLSTYIREFVERARDNLKEIISLQLAISTLRHEIRDLIESNYDNSNTTNCDKEIMIEILLLLRHLSKPDSRKEVRADMQRMGLKTWCYDEE